MTILTRLTSQHLDDATLAEVWTNATASGEPAAHAHLDACPECRVRYASFTAWMDDLRLEGVAEADQAFSTERLAAQHAQILRRVDALSSPTRVIAFPKAPAVVSRPSPMRRWVTAAAAAGLITGIGLGQLMDLRHTALSPNTYPVAANDTARSQPHAPAVVPASFTDDEALAELEAAATPQYEALRAYDAFTPRAADLLLTSR